MDVERIRLAQERVKSQMLANTIMYEPAQTDPQGMSNRNRGIMPSLVNQAYGQARFRTQSEELLRYPPACSMRACLKRA